MKEINSPRVHAIEYDSDDEVQDGYLDDQFTVEIKSTRYEETDPSEVAFKQTHLTQEQRNALGKLLSSYPDLIEILFLKLLHQI